MSTINPSHLRLLAVFAMVVDSGSFAAAARKLNSSRSRVSEQVSSLESILGMRLLQRSTRQLTVTAEGQAVFEQARKFEDILQQVEVIANPSEPSGRVSLTLNHDIAHRFLLPVLATFQQRFPKIELDLILDDNKTDLISEQVDLAIRIGLPNDENLVGRIMHEDSLGIFASPKYLAGLKTITNLDELKDKRWILLTQSHHRSVILREGKKNIELSPRHFYKCNSPFMVQQMAMQGLGLAEMLPSLIQQEIACGKLVSVCPHFKGLNVQFSLVYPSRRQLPLRTRVLVDFLLEARIFSLKP